MNINIFTTGFGLIISMYLLAFLVGFAYRFLVRKFSKKLSMHDEILRAQRSLGEVGAKVGRGSKNIGKGDRLLRLLIGVGLLAWAVMTTFSPILLFFSGFCIFEALFSWCGFYAAIGKTTCPSEA